MSNKRAEETSGATFQPEIDLGKFKDFFEYILDKNSDPTSPPPNFPDQWQKLLYITEFLNIEPLAKLTNCTVGLQWLGILLDTDNEPDITKVPEEYKYLLPMRNFLIETKKRPLANLALTSELRSVEKVLSSRITNIDNQLNALFPAVRPKPKSKIDISLTKAHVHVR